MALPPQATAQYTFFPIKNALIPSEGPKAIPVLLDFSANQAYGLNLTQQVLTKKISTIQSIYFDNSQNGGMVEIFFDQNSQQLRLPPYMQGYIPVLVPTSPNITFQCLNGTGNFYCALTNVPIDAVIWNSQGQTFNFDNSGNILVSDPILDGLVTGNNALQVEPQLLGNNDTPYIDMLGTRVFSQQVTASGSITILTGAPSFFIKEISISISNDATHAAGVNMVVTLADGVNTLLNTRAAVPAAAPANPIGRTQLLHLSNLNYFSRGTGNNLNIITFDTLATGDIYVNIVGGFTAQIGV